MLLTLGVLPYEIALSLFLGALTRAYQPFVITRATARFPLYQELVLLPLKLLISRVVSMGRRNTSPKTYLQMFQWLDSSASVDSRKMQPA